MHSRAMTLRALCAVLALCDHYDEIADSNGWPRLESIAMIRNAALGGRAPHGQ